MVVIHRGAGKMQSFVGRRMGMDLGRVIEGEYVSNSESDDKNILKINCYKNV